MSHMDRELSHSGCSTKMDGCIENGKKVYRVLLWIEPDYTRSSPRTIKTLKWHGFNVIVGLDIKGLLKSV